ncbi:MAG: hypothetical protein ACM3ZE_05670 [Myxococcales bacterium]
MSISTARSKQGVLGILAIVGTTSVSAASLPAGTNDALTLDTLKRANAALTGHPAQPKVSLLAERSSGGMPSSAVHVLPLKAQAKLALQRTGEQDCDLIASALTGVNNAIDALAVLAQDLLNEANHISELFDAYAEYSLEHVAELELAAQGVAKIIAAETFVTDILAALLMETEPALLEFYREELVKAQNAVIAARNDPTYAAALAVKSQADALMDAALNEYDAWEGQYSVKLEAANAALEVAQTLYDDLSNIEIASAEARLPIWDPDILSLLTENGGVRDGIRFVPAMLEDPSWSIQDANLPRLAPIQIELSGTHQTQLEGVVRVRPLPGLNERAPLEPFQGLSESDYQVTSSTFAVGTMKRSLSRSTNALVVDSPLVRANVVLGAYCGSVFDVEKVTAAENGADTSAALRVTNYEFVPRTRGSSETYLGKLDYKVRVLSEPVRVNCSLDLARYATVTKGKPVDVDWLWYGYDKWDSTLLERLSHLGLVCSVSDPAMVRALGDDNAVRESLSWAVSDVLQILRQLTSNPFGAHISLSDVEIPSGDLSYAGQSFLCTNDQCLGPALLPLLVQIIKRTFPPRLAGYCEWPSTSWKTAQLQSELEFVMPAGL